MKTIRVSDEVWEEIAKRGHFGETPDIVLRRVFQLDKPQPHKSTSAYRRSRIATQKMKAFIEYDYLHVSFESGTECKWALPSKTEKAQIREVRDKAVGFAIDNEATEGQINAVKKALTSKGYFVTENRN